MTPATAGARPPWYQIGMRTLVAAMLCLAACRLGEHGDDDGWPPGDDGPRPPDAAGRLGTPCHIDDECAEGVCAYGTEVCTLASELKQVKATWTLRGAPASVAACRTSPDLAIGFFYRGGRRIGFSPVPCELGQFTMIKLPLGYDEAELGRDGGAKARLPITATNLVAFDLAL